MATFEGVLVGLLVCFVRFNGGCGEAVGGAGDGSD